MQQKKILRICAAILIAVIGIRMVSICFFSPLAGLLPKEAMLCLLIYTQTGRIIRPAVQDSVSEPTKSIPQTQITQLSTPETQGSDAVISFSPEELSLVDVYYYCDYQPDLAALLTAPLALDLKKSDPTVLIIHSHTTESYTGAFDYVEAYRCIDEEVNMVAIGAEVARVLELGGISVIHDRNIYDYPDYNNAYNATRAAIQAYLETYPSIQLVLDLHRDAASGDAGQLVTQATVNGQQSAQLMMVVGTDKTGLYHPNWQENLALALKLSVVLEQENPGIVRPISLRSQRFNEDLTTGSLLIEVGAAGNTLEEAMIAANALAEGILTLTQ